MHGVQHGAGSMLFPNGDRYDGMFEQGKRTNFGKLTMANGDCYEGNFEMNQRHGHGKMTQNHSIDSFDFGHLSVEQFMKDSFKMVLQTDKVLGYKVETDMRVVS